MNDIPLFPLPLVLFPGGRLALQVCESGHLDLISQCMKRSEGFGIVMIDDVEEEDELSSEVSAIGTYAQLVDFDQLKNGMLGVIVEGCSKFCIQDLYETPDGLLMGKSEFLEPESNIAMPEEKSYLAELLESLADHEAVRRLNMRIDFADALDVGSRLAELIPCPISDKQELLELDSPLVRLEQVAKIVAKLQQSSWM